MAKSKRKTKQNKLLAIIASVLLLASFVIPFLDSFAVHVGTDSSTISNSPFGIFADYSSMEYIFEGCSVWLTINSIAIIGTAVFALAYIVLFLLSLAGVKIKQMATINFVVAIGVFAFALIMVVTGVLATALNHIDTLLGFTEISGEIGFFLQFLPLAGGVLALIAALKK